MLKPEQLAYFDRNYGSLTCTRKACDSRVAHLDGYCEEHHNEWIAELVHRNMIEISVQAEIDKIGKCSKCDEPRVHSKSSYCTYHRYEYNHSLYLKKKAEQL
jgi:hypothetical protein